MRAAFSLTRSIPPLVWVIFILTGAPTAQGQVPAGLSASATPTTLSYPAAASVSYSISIATGAEAVDFGLQWSSPSWPDPALYPEGTPLRFAAPALQGPGSIQP